MFESHVQKTQLMVTAVCFSVCALVILFVLGGCFGGEHFDVKTYPPDIVILYPDETITEPICGSTKVFYGYVETPGRLDRILVLDENNQKIYEDTTPVITGSGTDIYEFSATLDTSTKTEGEYTWTVLTFDKTGVPSTRTFSFTIGRVSNQNLEDTLNVCGGDDASLSWSYVEGENYEVEFYDGTAWITPDVVTDGLATIENPILNDGYKWRIRQTYDECATEWVESDVFDVNPLSDVFKMIVQTNYIPDDPPGSGVDPIIQSTWEIPDCNIKAVEIRRSEAGIPTDLTDGDVVSPTSLTSFSDSGVDGEVGNIDGDTLYYYNVWVQSQKDVYTSGESFAAVAGKPAVVLEPVTQPIVIDGKDDDAAWDSAVVLDFNYEKQVANVEYSNDPNISGYLKFAYDEDNLYIFAQFYDKYLNYWHWGDGITDPMDFDPNEKDGPEDGILWGDDFEIFLDMAFDRSFKEKTGEPETCWMAVELDDYHFHFQLTDPSAPSFSVARGTGQQANLGTSGGFYDSPWDYLGDQNATPFTRNYFSWVEPYSAMYTAPSSIENALYIEGTPNDNSDIDTGWTQEVKLPFETLIVDGHPAHVGGSGTPSSITAGSSIGIGIKMFDWEGTYNDGGDANCYSDCLAEPQTAGTCWNRCRPDGTTSCTPACVANQGWSTEECEAQCIAWNKNPYGEYKWTPDLTGNMWHCPAEWGTLTF
jgi:hypothetical protein